MLVNAFSHSSCDFLGFWCDDWCFDCMMRSLWLFCYDILDVFQQDASVTPVAEGRNYASLLLDGNGNSGSPLVLLWYPLGEEEPYYYSSLAHTGKRGSHYFQVGIKYLPLHFVDITTSNVPYYIWEKLEV